jgi:hypothetical protein
MTVKLHGPMIALAVVLLAPDAGNAQAPTPVALTAAEMEHFLLKAEIVKAKRTRKGVTNARQVTLSNGVFSHDAQVQDVDIHMPMFDVGPRHSEVNFRDTYRYNIAGYRLAMLLGLDNVPMSVEREVNGKPAAVTWWIDDVAMDEEGRQKKGTAGPDPVRTTSYLHVMRVFDELIQNRDRNAGNLLWTADWKMWLIDHTRAFRLGKSLLKPQRLERIDRTLFDRLQLLTQSRLEEVMAESLKAEEIAALLTRRDEIVKLFSDRIATRGESVVLFELMEHR